MARVGHADDEFGLRTAEFPGCGDNTETEVSSDEEDAAGPADFARQPIMNDKVRSWRRDKLIHTDADFVFAFSPYDEAYEKAGGAVAEAWKRMRKREEARVADESARIFAVARSWRRQAVQEHQSSPGPPTLVAKVCNETRAGLQGWHPPAHPPPTDMQHRSMTKRTAGDECTCSPRSIHSEHPGKQFAAR